MIEQKNLSRKERERLFRKSEILNAAIELFGGKGYTNTTLDEIAEASEFGKGTIYNYFQNKEEIYTAILEEVVGNYLQIVKDAIEKSNKFKELITQITEELVNYCLNNKHAFLILVRDRIQGNSTDINKNNDNLKSIYKEILDILNSEVDKAVKSKEIKNLDIQSLLNMYRSMIFPYLHSLLLCHGDTSEINAKKESEFILTVLFEGILNKK